MGKLTDSGVGCTGPGKPSARAGNTAGIHCNHLLFQWQEMALPLTCPIKETHFGFEHPLLPALTLSHSPSAALRRTFHFFLPSSPGSDSVLNTPLFREQTQLPLSFPGNCYSFFLLRGTSWLGQRNRTARGMAATLKPWFLPQLPWMPTASLPCFPAQSQQSGHIMKILRWVLL